MQQLNDKKLVPNLICHPLAVPAFEFTQEIFCSPSSASVSKHKLKHFGQRQHLAFFEKSCGNKLFFTGWLPLLLTPENVRKQDVLNGPSNIEFKAWSYALDAILSLSSRSEVLPNLALFFSKVPQGLIFRFFSGRTPKTLQAQIIEFTGESRASVRYFLGKVEVLK